MPVLYTYSKARQKFAKVLEQAVVEGEVLIQRRDGQLFVIRPVLKKNHF
jgi:PHD/YefM family antitoxin component YafN of YafNO toxin-antitoxin module